MLGEFNEAGKPKTSLVKFSIEFNDFGGSKAKNTVFETVWQTLYISEKLLHVKRSVGSLVTT